MEYAGEAPLAALQIQTGPNYNINITVTAANPTSFAAVTGMLML